MQIHSFEIQGHRGARGILPENSLPAFETALTHNIKTVEMDLLLTNDNEIVIHHNFQLNPTICTFLDGTFITETPLIKDLTLNDLKKIDCGRLKNPKFSLQQTKPNTTIPTLQELFSFLQNHPHPNAQTMILNLEIKADPCTPQFIPNHELVAKKIVAAVHQYGFQDRVYYSSFDFNVLTEVRKIDKDAQIGLLIETETLQHYNIDPNFWPTFLIKLGKELKATIISPDYKLLNSNDVALLHAEGFKVIPWTVNSFEEVKELISMKVDGIITDYPMDLTELLPSIVR